MAGGQNPSGQMLMDKTHVKIGGEDEMLALLWHREDKMSILSKQLIYHTDGQVNCKPLAEKKPL